MIRADYTIVLKTLLDDPQSKALIDEAMSTYHLYTPENNSKFTQVMTREEINKRILNHYKYREIGFETFGRFLDELKIALEEIMPYYNQLFVSQDIINGLEDIFGNLDVTEQYDEETSGTNENDTRTAENTKVNGSESQTITEDVTSSSEANSNGSDSSTTSSNMTTDSKNIKAETPQSQLAITSKNIDNVEYADEVSWNKANSENSETTSGSTTSESSSESSQNKKGSVDTTKEEESEASGSITTSGTTTGINKHTLHRKGNQGVNTYAHDMLEFRQLFINIVQQIINDKRIKELFMQVF